MGVNFAPRPSANGVVPLFAHVGAFMFGLLVTRYAGGLSVVYNQFCHSISELMYMEQ